MQQEKKVRPRSSRKLTKAERKTLAGYDNLQYFITRTIARAARLKAREIRYERGKDGLTVQFRKDNDVLETKGPYKRYQDKVIPRLVKMGEQGLPKTYKGETGRFYMLGNEREWNCPVFHSRTRAGERMVVRFTSSKPWKGLQDLGQWTNATLLQGIAFKATEVSYERGKDGLTLQYRRGTRVLGTPRPAKHFQDKVIPWLKKKAKIDPAKQGKRLTGKFDAIVDGRVWDFHVTSTATKSGERMVVRFSRRKPGKGQK